MPLAWFKKGKSYFVETRIGGTAMIFTKKEIERATKRKYGMYKHQVKK